jgi:hypothetical protein
VYVILRARNAYPLAAYDFSIVDYFFISWAPASKKKGGPPMQAALSIDW